MNPRDVRDSDAPLGYPCPHSADETSGWVVVWLGVAMIIGGLVCWWAVVST